MRSHVTRDVEAEVAAEIATAVEGDETEMHKTTGEDLDRGQENAREDDGQGAETGRITGRENTGGIGVVRPSTMTGMIEGIVITSIGGESDLSLTTMASRWRSK